MIDKSIRDKYNMTLGDLTTMAVKNQSAGRYLILRIYNNGKRIIPEYKKNIIIVL